MSKVLIDRELLSVASLHLEYSGYTETGKKLRALLDTPSGTPSGTPAMPVKAYYHEAPNEYGGLNKSVGLEVRKAFTDAPLVLEADALARIACLEGEIAKRDEELAACRIAVENCDLFRARIAELEQDLAYFPSTVRSLAETVTEREAEINQLRTELAALKAQEPVGSIEIQGTGFLCAPFPAPAWAGGRQPAVGTKLYAAPVSEAKAQGVVMPERANASHGSHDHQSGWNECLKEVARLNAAPVQHVGVPVEIGEVSVAINNGSKQFVFDEYSAAYALPVGTHYLYAAPAAPAADAVCSDCNGSEWQTLPDEEGVLRDVKCHCALAAHRAQGVV